MNARIMLLIQAMAPFIIMTTYLLNSRFQTPTNRGGQMRMSFSKQYLQKGGLFMRAALSWCFLGAAVYTFRPLLQSYLDQAATVASAMVSLGEGSSNDAKTRNKHPAQATTSKPDPFNDRYNTLVSTAGHIAVFPAFVLAMLALAHILGGDGSHPGVGHVSQLKDAPRSTVLPVRGLLPPYSDQYMSWIASESKLQETGPGDTLLHAAALTESLWYTTPFRDSAHMKVVNRAGKQKFCHPPELRSVKAAGRHVTFLLDSDGDNDEGSFLTLHPLTGRELLDCAPPLPFTAADFVLGRAPAATSPKDGSCKTDDSNEGSEECKAPLQHPSFSEMLSFVWSHKFLTPTIIFPIIDTFGLLLSVWWTYWYSIRMRVYWTKLRGAAFQQIAA